MSRPTYEVLLRPISQKVSSLKTIFIQKSHLFHPAGVSQVDCNKFMDSPFNAMSVTHD